MEYSDLITKRYSVRAYRPDPVEDEKLGAVLEDARLAQGVDKRVKADGGPLPRGHEALVQRCGVLPRGEIAAHG